MRIPFRKIFAALLFALAAVPFVLWAVHQSSPLRAISLYSQTTDYGQTILLWTGIVAAVAALAYPPAIPFLRLSFARTWRRLGTDRGPLHDGLARLRHLETHDDRLKVGRMALQLGEIPLALENLGRAFELDPSHLTGRYQFALVLLETGNHAQAVEVLASIVAEDERHAFGDALFQLGRGLLRLHRDTDAIAALRRHLELFPGGRSSNLLLARALAASGEMDAARAALLVARGPVDPERHLTKEEALARAQAKITILKSGKHHD